MNGFGKALMSMIHISMNRTIARRISSGVTALALAGIVLLVAAGGANAGEQGGIGCVNSTGWAYQCGDTVTESCTFNGDLSCESGHGLVIGSDDVTIDGYEYAITGPGCTDTYIAGIYNMGYDNVTIKNIEVEDFCTGIKLHNACYNDITNCRIHNNTYNSSLSWMGCCGEGISVFQCSYHCNMTNNQVYDNDVVGIYTSNSATYGYAAYNDVFRNGKVDVHFICGGTPGGIGLSGCGTTGWVIEHNNITDNYGKGFIDCGGCGGSCITIRYNNITNTKYISEDSPGYGIVVWSDYGVMTENTVCGNAGDDIHAGVTITGDNNTCDTTYNYNDSGTTGCTYKCVHQIVIRDAPDGGGSEVTTHTMTTDETFQVWAAGYDADGNYTGDVLCTWSTTGTLDAVLPGYSTNTIFTPSTAGTTGMIIAECDKGYTDDTGTIIVNAGVLDHIIIRDAPSGGGSKACDRIMAPYETWELWAAGYDAENNYIMDINCNWTTTGTLDYQTASNINTFTFTPSTAGTSGTITADNESGHTDATGTIAVEDELLIGCVGVDTGHVYGNGQTVTESCVFNGDMNCPATGNGLVVGEDNIVIDGAGHLLNGSVESATCDMATHSGIVNVLSDNVVVKDLEIQNFCSGIEIGDYDMVRTDVVANMTVTGCKIHDCGRLDVWTHGIYMIGPIYCDITKNEIYNISGFNEGSCTDGGNGIFIEGGSFGEHGNGDDNTINCNRIYDVMKSGIFSRYGCMHNTMSHNHITGCGEGGIVPMCMRSDYNTYEYNNLSENDQWGFETGGNHNNIRFNTANNNGDYGFYPGGNGNSITNNSACGNPQANIWYAAEYNTGDSNTCNSGPAGCCDWNCNNQVPVYFDFDNDEHYSGAPDNCTCNNTLGIGSCCNPGLFNASHAAMLNASGICWLVPGDDPNDCDPSIPDAKPDLVITEKSEEWISQEDKTYNITYTIKNIGNADANESTTSIRTDGTEVATDPVPALVPDATHNAELGPFTMSDGSDTIRVCADNELVVTESNEDNNCKENIFKFHGKPDLVISKKYEEWVASNETYSLYTITYAIENIGTGGANESTTSILIDGIESATDPVEALGEGETYTNTIGPFTMSDVSDTIIICADNESVIDESDEGNNCIENTFNYSEIGCVAEDGTLFRCGNTATKSCTFNGEMTCPGAGLIIGTDGITIDGNVHRMTGTVTPADCDGMGSESAPCTVSGIYNPGFDNATIKNLEIEGFCTGIALAGTGINKVCNITVNNCSIHDNGFDTGYMTTHGIHASNTDGSVDVPALTITENKIYNNEGTGAACGDGGNGIFVFAGSGDKHEYCNISHNKLHNNAKAGFWTKMMLTRSEIAHNEIWGNGYGTGISDGQRGGIILRCAMSNKNLIAHNDVHDNDVDGIFIGGSNNTIEYNNVTNNIDDGIDVGRSDGSYNNELYENTVCDNWDKDISTFGAGSNTIGDDNTCDTTKDYDDNGTTGCTYSCGGSAGICGDVDGLPGVTTNDGRQIFMYLLHGADAYPLADTWAADCDGLCDGITTNDGRQIFMHLLHGADAYPLNCC